MSSSDDEILGDDLLVAPYLGHSSFVLDYAFFQYISPVCYRSTKLEVLIRERWISVPNESAETLYLAIYAFKVALEKTKNLKRAKLIPLN